MRSFSQLALSMILVFACTVLIPGHGISQSSVPKPEEHFGFVPGADRMLFDYEEMISYFVKLDEVSPMIRLVENGMSPMGKKMYIVFISSEENIRNLDKLRGINRELALNPTLSEKK